MPQPSFLIIGAGKSGTTSLYHQLRHHPQVYMSPIKEPNFFAVERSLADTDDPGSARSTAAVGIETWDAYVSLFNGAGAARAIGEASTSYFYTPQAPERIHHYLPNVKLVAILRHPVDRFYSSLTMLVRDSGTAYDRPSDILDIVRNRASNEFRYAFNGGLYARHLRRYFDRFRPDQIQVLLFEDLRADLPGTLDQLHDFLNVRRHAPIKQTAYNAGGLYRSKLMKWLLRDPSPLRGAAGRWLPERFRGRLSESVRNRVLVRPPPLTAELRRQLLDDYRADIEALQDLLDRDLGRWLA